MMIVIIKMTDDNWGRTGDSKAKGNGEDWGRGAPGNGCSPRTSVGIGKALKRAGDMME
jgi:hypothetical protein